MTNTRNLYKKSTVILMNMARDLFLSEVGQQVPTIQEYTDTFHVSRGIVQKAMETLIKDGSIQVEKRGVLGSYLTKADQEKLYAHTGWESITGTMPIPMTPYFTSLATAICEELSKAPVGISFAYMSGSSKRAETLANGVYDFMVSSRSAAKLHMKEYPDLKICAELTGAEYSKEYVLYFLDPSKSKIEDGMRMGVDPVCEDQRVLTEKLCKGKNVEIVEFPFIGVEDILVNRKADCVVFRKIGWNEHAEQYQLNEVPIEGIRGFSIEDMNTPVVLVNDKNYGIDRLLAKYLDAARISEIQQEVLRGDRTMKFY